MSFYGSDIYTTKLIQKGIHREYQTLVSLLKLLFFFSLAFCLAVSSLAHQGPRLSADMAVPHPRRLSSPKNNTAEFVITIIAMPLTPIVILACGYAVRKENMPYVTCHFSQRGAIR